MIGCVRGKPRRWVIERASGWHDRFRGLLVRWERIPADYLARVQLASGLITFHVAQWF
jgi:transposase